MRLRLAIVAGLVLTAGAVLVTLLPATPAAGIECGTWVAPEWDDDTTRELLDDAQRIHDRTDSPEIAAGARQVARDVRRAADLCAPALSARRAIALSLAGLALILPAAVIWVGRSRRDEGT